MVHYKISNTKEGNTGKQKNKEDKRYKKQSKMANKPYLISNYIMHKYIKLHQKTRNQKNR